MSIKYLFLLAILTTSFSACSYDTTGKIIKTPSNQQLNTNFLKHDASENDNPPVKKSRANICHARGSTYYSRTKTYMTYQTIQDCINSGGRLPLE